MDTCSNSHCGVCGQQYIRRYPALQVAGGAIIPALPDTRHDGVHKNKQEAKYSTVVILLLHYAWHFCKVCNIRFTKILLQEDTKVMTPLSTTTDDGNY
jgi:hypothetical protein